MMSRSSSRSTGMTCLAIWDWFADIFDSLHSRWRGGTSTELRAARRARAFRRNSLSGKGGAGTGTGTGTGTSGSSGNLLDSSRSVVLVLNNQAANDVEGYPSNSIRTSKYSLLSFLPVNLFEQFRRFANFYFLVIILIQIIPNVSPFPIYTSVIPLGVILATSAIKEAAEDYSRHKQDRKANHTTFTRITAKINRKNNTTITATTNNTNNNSGGKESVELTEMGSGRMERNGRSETATVSSGTSSISADCFSEIRSRDIRVGMLLRIDAGQEFPADLVLLASSDPTGLAYVNTANLDGEAVPKPRTAPASTLHAITPELILSLRGQIKAEPPNPALYSFQGRIELDAENEIPVSPSDAERLETEREKAQALGPGVGVAEEKESHFTEDGEEFEVAVSNAVKQRAANVDKLTGRLLFPIGDSQLCLRGSRLSQTDWIFGVVMYTGVDTKMMQNRNPVRFKLSLFESKLNRFVLILFGFHFLVCLILSLSYLARDHSWAYYSNLDDYTLYGSRGAGWIYNFLTQYILFSFIIPMSLYVTIELVKVGQAFFMIWDERMIWWDADSAEWKPMQVKSSSLNEELGCVDYVFSDKTGTLTRNKMELSAVSVNGTVYEEDNETELAIRRGKPNGTEIKQNQKAGKRKSPFASMAMELEAEHRREEEQEEKQHGNDRDTEEMKVPDDSNLSHRMSELVELAFASASSASSASVSASTSREHSLPASPVLTALSSSKAGKNESGPVAVHLRSVQSAWTPTRTLEREFLLNLVLCNSVLPVARTSSTHKHRQDRNSGLVRGRGGGRAVISAESSQISLPDKDKEKRKLVDEVEEQAIADPDLESEADSSTAAHAPTFSSSFSPRYVFQSMSPDEVALCEACHRRGLTLIERKGENLTIEYQRPSLSAADDENAAPSADSPSSSVETHQYRVLATLEFTSARARMSVLVRLPSNQYRLYTKGADSAVSKLLAPLSQADPVREATFRHVESFAGAGSRTLVYAYRPIPRAELDSWEKTYQQAVNALEDRESLVELAFQEIEHDLILLGCSGVEDQLQELVPETIDYMIKAGLRVVVLTGDKKETAVTIARQAKLVQRHQQLIYLHGITRDSASDSLNAAEQALAAAPATAAGSPVPYSVAVDGLCMEYLLRLERDRFIRLFRGAETVVAYRSTPRQKALCVSMAKDDLRVRCLAIGDGANDVSMILASHVGVGIQGREGSHAALSADFVIYRFHHLLVLIFLQGRFCFYRTAKICFYSFYKNLVFPLPQFFFSFWSLNSGQTLFVAIFMSAYNLLFTSLPPLLCGWYEKDLPDHIILANPDTYKLFHRDSIFTFSHFFRWWLLAAYHGFICFFIMLGVLSYGGGDVTSDGRGIHLLMAGMLIFSAVIILTNLKMLTSLDYITRPAIGATLIGIFLYILALIAFNFHYSTVFATDGYLIATNLFTTNLLWSYIAVVLLIAYLPTLSSHFIGQFYRPTQAAVLRAKYSQAASKHLEHTLPKPPFQLPSS